ncbi:MAG: MotA/TolQ/ExbB proton channel family protein [Bacteroidota bacterium]
MTLSALLLLQEAASDNFANELVFRFNEGGNFMWPVLITLIIGLAIAFERILSLNRADINARKFMARVKEALDSGGVSAAEDVCADTRGPVASVVQAGLTRFDEGMDAVEKAVVSYGSIEMSFLERGLVWLSLGISLAPMFGFLGTVIGMVEAFDAIEQAGDISPSLVANGIKIALLTTVFGLIAAIILQVFYNYCVSKIDRITADMEEASVELIDSLAMMSVGRPAIGARSPRATLPDSKPQISSGDDAASNNPS